MKKIMFPIFMAKFTIYMQQEKKKFLKKFYLISNQSQKYTASTKHLKNIYCLNFSF